MSIRLRCLFASALFLTAFVPLSAEAMGGRVKEAAAPSSASRAPASPAPKPSGYGIDDYLGRNAASGPVLEPPARKISRSGYGIDELP